jgi:DNA-binding CsgD family transcriptional regulator
VVYRQPSESRSTSPAGRARLEASTPEDIEAHSFEIGSDRYVILSFPVGAEGPPHDLSRRLTSSERDIVARVLRGQSNAAVGKARGRSPRIVANQLSAIHVKLGVRSRREPGVERERAGGTT